MRTCDLFRQNPKTIAINMKWRCNIYLCRRPTILLDQSIWNSFVDSMQFSQLSKQIEYVGSHHVARCFSIVVHFVAVYTIIELRSLKCIN